MKSLLVSLISLLVVVGCADQKDRLADQNNKEYQKKLLQKKGLTEAERRLIIAENGGAASDTNAGAGDTNTTATTMPDPSKNENREQQTGAAPSQGSAGPAKTNANVVPVTAGSTAPDPLANTQNQAKPTAPVAELKPQPETKTQPQAQAQPQQETKAANPAPTAQPQAQAQQPAQPGAESAQKPEPAAAQGEQGQAAGDKKYGPEYFTFKELIVFEILSNHYKEEFEKRLTQVGSESAEMEIKVEGKKAHLKLTQENQVVVDIPNFPLDKVGQIFDVVVNEKNVTLVCMGTQCDFIFVSVYTQAANKSMTYNYARVFKLVDGQYVLGKVKEQADYAVEAEAMKTEIAAQEAAEAAKRGGADPKAVPAGK